MQMDEADLAILHLASACPDGALGAEQPGTCNDMDGWDFQLYGDGWFS